MTMQNLTARAFTVTADNLVFNFGARDWCTLPYPGHPYGCPNYAHNDTCPPVAPLIFHYADFSRPMALVVIYFDLQSHVGRMRTAHPSWTERQCRNVLYWQGAVNSRLKLFCEGEIKRRDLQGYQYTLRPEAMGIDVIHTVKRLGVPISARPRDSVYKVGLVCFPPVEKERV